MPALIACLDVDYREDHALAACVLLREWSDAKAERELVARVDAVEPYEPGAFYKRELPCLLAVLARVSDPLACVVVDAYVWLDSAGRRGLGAHLYASLGESVPVVGVAKKRFGGGDFATPVRRGESATPLWVTAAGVSREEAAERVRAMHGRYRVPTMLTRVDRLCRDTRA